MINGVPSQKCAVEILLVPRENSSARRSGVPGWRRLRYSEAGTSKWHLGLDRPVVCSEVFGLASTKLSPMHPNC